MLDKELNKLRDKTLSFWCFIKEYPWESMLWAAWWTFRSWSKQDSEDRVYDEILWHPLTYWRIYSLSYKLRSTKSWKVADEILYNKTDIERILKEKDLIDKTELERQQSPHREELKELLLKFSNYL